MHRDMNQERTLFEVDNRHYAFDRKMEHYFDTINDHQIRNNKMLIEDNLKLDSLVHHYLVDKL